MDFHIVQSREDAFSAYPEASRYYAFFQMRVGLQDRLEQRTYENDHLIIESLHVCIFQRHVVFVDQDDRLASVADCQRLRKDFQCSAVVFILCIS